MQPKNSKQRTAYECQEARCHKQHAVRLSDSNDPDEQASGTGSQCLLATITADMIADAEKPLLLHIGAVTTCSCVFINKDAVALVALGLIVSVTLLLLTLSTTLAAFGA